VKFPWGFRGVFVRSAMFLKIGFLSGHFDRAEARNSALMHSK